MEHGVRYMPDRKLKNSDLRELDIRAPICLVCGRRLHRLAYRDVVQPYQWIPTGWWCEDCTIIDITW